MMKRCIASWKKYCPDYQIVEWNEDNFDLANSPLYVRQAYEAKKWAFVSDWVRLKVVYEYGGIYLDTDVELLKGMDDLLVYDSFFAAETKMCINTGLGFGAVAKNELVYSMLNYYSNKSFFIETEKRYDLTACPVLQTEIIRSFLGNIKNFDTLVLYGNNIFFPRDYFCPLDFTTRSLMYKTGNTRAIHWYSASWFEDNWKKKASKQYWLYFFHRLIINTFGMKTFQRLKNFILEIFNKK
jgi:glycosyltransferase